MDDRDFLVGKAAIMQVLKVGKREFARFVDEGLPVDTSGKTYRAYRPVVLKWLAKRAGAEAEVR